MPATSTSILDNLDSVAVMGAGIFAGTALYVTIGEVPAFRKFGLEHHWKYFPYMYERAAISQATSAIVAGLAGIVHGSRIVGSSFDRNLWFGAGTIFVGIIPYTIFSMFPTNKTIINDSKLVTSGKQSQFDAAAQKDLLEKWTVLHLVRTVSSVAGFGVMIYGLSRHSSLVLGW